MTPSVRAYRNSATVGATQIDILLACYDALSEDISRAGKSAAKGDVVARCRYSERGLLLIGHLESWISLLDDDNLATSLTNFYTYLRCEILRLQLSDDLDEFMRLALMVCETRAAWQRKQSEKLSLSGGNAESALSFGEPERASLHFMASA